jgi:flagellar protein FlgJ
MLVDTTQALSPSAKAPNPHDSPEKIQKAAKDFEALLIGQMLKSVRESSFGGGWGTSDQSGDVALDMAEQQLAQLMASNGGLGLAKVITQGLNNAVQNHSHSPTPKPANAPGKSSS